MEQQFGPLLQRGLGNSSKRPRWWVLPGCPEPLGLLLGLFSERVVDTGGDQGRAWGRLRLKSGGTHGG